LVTPPPTTRRGDDCDVLHGVEVPDPYRWLEDGEAVEVGQWVAEHNRRTLEALTRPARGRWHERLSALSALPTIMSLAVAGEHLFVLERPAGADQYVLAVRSALVADEPSRVLVDPATLAADGAVAIDWFQPSPDGRLVAYGISEGGTENSLVHVMEVATARLLPDRIPDCRGASIAWQPDGSGFWYTRYPAGDEYHRHVRWHTLDTYSAADPVVLDDFPTAESWPDVSASDDGRYLLVHVGVGWTRVDIHLLDTASGRWSVVVEGVEAQTSMHFAGDALVGVTTLDAPNGRVVRALLTAPAEWETVVPARDDVVLGALTPCADEILVVASSVAVDALERWPAGERIDLGIAGVTGLDAAAGRAFVARASFAAPTDVLRYTTTDGLRPWSTAPDPTVLPALTVSRVFYPSRDGTRIPMFVAHRADVVPSADSPLVLRGYGGFAIAESPTWMLELAAWCAAGGVYCVAGLRGGWEYGEAWHHAGRRENKQNVFDDFAAAADWLVANGYTRRERLAIYGRSNGGLLVGAVLTQRPDIAAAVWCGVPLLDMVRFPQFLIARLWTDEYGDPDVAEEFAWLHAYSPYHHVREGESYPAVLFTTAEGDTRVDPCHARKMAALLIAAAANQDQRPILLHQEGRAGHGVGKPASKRVDELADALAFFSWQLAADDIA
jgi:prolyl oligopeptidase